MIPRPSRRTLRYLRRERAYRRETRPRPVGLEQVIEGAQLGDATHSGMMMIHGWGALVTGILMALVTSSTSASFFLVGRLPGWPGLYAFTLALAGLALVICRFRGGKPRLGVIALVIITAWYALFAVSFVATWTLWLAAVWWTTPDLAWSGLLAPWSTLTEWREWWLTTSTRSQPALYPFAIYGLLTVLCGTHVRLVIRRHRGGLGGQCPADPGALCES